MLWHSPGVQPRLPPLLLFLQGHGTFKQTGEITAQNLAAVPAFPQRVLRVEVVEIHTTAFAHDLKSRAASTHNLHIFRSHPESSSFLLEAPARLQPYCLAHIVPDCRARARSSLALLSRQSEKFLLQQSRKFLLGTVKLAG